MQWENIASRASPGLDRRRLWTEQRQARNSRAMSEGTFATQVSLGSESVGRAPICTPRERRQVLGIEVARRKRMLDVVCEPPHRRGLRALEPARVEALRAVDFEEGYEC